MKRLCTICARGGSKGVKNKNIRQLCGIPLIAHSINQAKESAAFDKIAVSSDSDAILAIAKEYGADFMIKRPDNLAQDTSAKLPAIKHCVTSVESLLGIEFDIIVDLDATSPLREMGDIIGTLSLLQTENCTNVITGASARRSPYFNLVEIDDKGVVRLAKNLDKPIVRRQDAPLCFDMNASIYAWFRKSLMCSDSIFQSNTRIYIMPEERSIDIDSELDFKFIEFIMSSK